MTELEDFVSDFESVDLDPERGGVSCSASSEGVSVGGVSPVLMSSSLVMGGSGDS